MTGGKARMELRALAVSALKLNLYLVTYSDARGLQGGTAHANAEAAASDEHRTPGEGYAVERTGYPHLAAPSQLGNQLDGDVDHGEAAWLVLPPAADTPTKKHHDQPYRVAGQHEKAASCRPMPYFAQP